MSDKTYTPHLLDVASRLELIDRAVQENRLMKLQDLGFLLNMTKSFNKAKSSDLLQFINAHIANNFDVFDEAIKIGLMEKRGNKKVAKKTQKSFSDTMSKGDAKSVEGFLPATLLKILDYTKPKIFLNPLSSRGFLILIDILSDKKLKKIFKKKYGNDVFFAYLEFFSFVMSNRVLDQTDNLYSFGIEQARDLNMINTLRIKEKSLLMDSSLFTVSMTQMIKQVFLDLVLIMNGMSQPQRPDQSFKDLKVLIPHVLEDEDVSFEDFKKYLNQNSEIDIDSLKKGLFDIEEYESEIFIPKKGKNTLDDFFKNYKDFCLDTLYRIEDLRSLFSTAQLDSMKFSLGGRNFKGYGDIDMLSKKNIEPSIDESEQAILILYLKTFDFASNYIKARLTYEEKLHDVNINHTQESIHLDDLSILSFTSSRSIKNEMWRADSVLNVKKNKVKFFKDSVKGLKNSSENLDIIPFANAHAWLNDEKRKYPFRKLIDCSSVISNYIDTNFFSELKQKKL